MNRRTDFENIISAKNRTHLLNLSKLKDADFSQELKNYIKSGEDKKINEGYKCKKRKRWYDVPIVKNGDACFFKRYHHLPRVIANTDKIHSTDIIYNIRFNKAYEAQSFAFCFYNSLTLALCEYNGRFYGGGVGELVPSEFKQLAIPYKTIAQVHIDHLDSLLRQNSQINDIIDYVDALCERGLEEKINKGLVDDLIYREYAMQLRRLEAVYASMEECYILSKQRDINSIEINRNNTFKRIATDDIYNDYKGRFY